MWAEINKKQRISLAKSFDDNDDSNIHFRSIAYDVVASIIS